MKSSANISERIESIQAINTIKSLKFKYWNACDSKKPADILACFWSDDVYINFEDFGIFSSVQDMVTKYELYSCHDMNKAHIWLPCLALKKRYQNLQNLYTHHPTKNRLGYRQVFLNRRHSNI